MATVKIGVFSLTFCLLYSVKDFILPLLSYITNPLILMTISWLIGVQITKRLLLKKLPRVSSDRKAVLITGMALY